MATVTVGMTVSLRRDHRPATEDAPVALFREHKPPDTLLGVEALSRPGFLIAVEAIAVVDER